MLVLARSPTASVLFTTTWSGNAGWISALRTEASNAIGASARPHRARMLSATQHLAKLPYTASLFARAPAADHLSDCARHHGFACAAMLPDCAARTPRS